MIITKSADCGHWPKAEIETSLLGENLGTFSRRDFPIFIFRDLWNKARIWLCVTLTSGARKIPLRKTFRSPFHRIVTLSCDPLLLLRFSLFVQTLENFLQQFTWGQACFWKTCSEHLLVYFTAVNETKGRKCIVSGDFKSVLAKQNNLLSSSRFVH